MFYSNNGSSNLRGSMTIPQPPQPVLGSFTDVWELRQESDILLEDAVEKKPECQAGNEHDFYFMDSYQSPAVETLPQQPPQQISSDDSCGMDVHNRRVYCYNPYSLTQPMVPIYSCPCDSCSGQGSPSESVQQHTRSTSYEYAPEESLPLSEHQVKQEGEEQEGMLPESTYVSPFMPPPPPRIDTCDVLFACGTSNADVVVYELTMRWFAKVCRVQHFFVAETEGCPEPSPAEYTFGEWCQKVSTWWAAHFEHMQKKPQPTFTGRQQHSGPRGHNGLW